MPKKNVIQEVEYLPDALKIIGGGKSIVIGEAGGINWPFTTEIDAADIDAAWRTELSRVTGIPADRIECVTPASGWGARYFDLRHNGRERPWRLFETKAAARNWLRDHKEN